MENPDLAPLSKESQGSHSNKRIKLGSDPTQASNMKEQAAEAKSTMKESEIKCYKCKEYGHKCSACPNQKIRKQSPTPEPYLPSHPNHLLCLRQIGTQSFHVPSKEEEQEAISSPRNHKQDNAGLINNFPQPPCQLTQWELPQPPPLPFQ